MTVLPHKKVLAKVVKDTLSTLQLEVLSHAAYLSDCVPSNYFDQCSMVLLISTSKREKIRKWLAEWIASKDEYFFLLRNSLIAKKVEKSYS